MRLPAILLVAAALVLAAAPAAASYPERTFEKTITVRAGGAGNEINLVLQSPGDYFRYEWTTGGVEVKFDIHTHVGSEVRTLKQLKEDEDKDVFTAENAGIYSLFFESLGEDAFVAVKIRGPFKLQGEPDPAPTASAIPGPGAAAGLGLAGAALLARRRD